MIRYALRCAAGHGFEGWFGSSSDYDDQAAGGLVDVPRLRLGAGVQGHHGARRRRRRSRAPEPAVAPAKMREMVRHAAREVRRHVLSEFDDVGPRFAAEARAIHEGQAEDRGIYGQATSQEVEALHADGVTVAPLPPEPVDESKLN